MYLSRSPALILLLAGAAHAQEAAWETYRAANTLARAEAWDAALPKFRAVLEVATEPDLRSAACYGVGLAAHGIVAAKPDRALACEGVKAIDCFLASDPPSLKARALAEERRIALQLQCQPPPPPPDEPPPAPVDRTAAAWLTGGAGVALAGGGILVGLAFSDAAEVRDRGRIGTAALEDRAQAELVSGYALLGVGAALGALAIWRWLDDDPGDPAIAVDGLGIRGRF